MNKTWITYATLWMMLFVHPAYGQKHDLAPLRNELGISLVRYASTPSNGIVYERNFHAYPFRAISYKRHMGRSAIRVSAARQQLTKVQVVPENWNSEGTYRAVFIKLGWERTLTAYRLSPYVAADITGIRSSTKGSAGGGFTGQYYDFNIEQTGIGLSPTLGLRYRPINRLSLFLETSLDILYSRYRGQYIQTWPEIAEPDYTENTTGFTGLFNPVSMLVVNITF